MKPLPRRAFCVAAAASVLLLVAAAPAAAIPLPGLPGVPGLPDLPGVGDLAGKVLKEFFELLFGKVPDDVGRGILAGLLEVPNFGDAGQYPALARLNRDLAPLCFVIVLLSTMCGLAFAVGDPISGTAEVLKRAGAALLMLMCWPRIGFYISQFFEAVTEGLLGTTSARGVVGETFKITAAQGFNPPFGPLLMMLTMLVVIGLVLMKIVLTYALGVMWVAMPLAIALYPWQRTSHLAGIATQTYVTMLAIPGGWALVMVVTGVLARGAAVFGGVRLPMQAFTTSAVLVLLMVAPFTLLRLARLGGLTNFSHRPLMHAAMSARTVHSIAASSSRGGGGAIPGGAGGGGAGVPGAWTAPPPVDVRAASAAIPLAYAGGGPAAGDDDGGPAAGRAAARPQGAPAELAESSPSAGTSGAASGSAVQPARPAHSGAGGSATRVGAAVAPPALSRVPGGWSAQAPSPSGAGTPAPPPVDGAEAAGTVAGQRGGRVPPAAGVLPPAATAGGAATAGPGGLPSGSSAAITPQAVSASAFGVDYGQSAAEAFGGPRAELSEAPVAPTDQPRDVRSKDR